jgi:hypothetical protein
MAKRKNKAAQEMARRRNKKYGKDWIKQNSLKAAAASVAARNAKKV